MAIQVFTIVVIAFFAFAILKVLTSFLFKKKISLARPEEFISEINAAKNKENQILVVYDKGYWEIKEETVSKEWSAEGGTQTFVDFDVDIDDTRYYSFMNKTLVRDEEGEHKVKVLKEIELSKATDAETFLKMKY